MTFADLTPEAQASLCQRVNRALLCGGPLYLATIATATRETHDVVVGALVAMMSRGAVACEPVRNGEKFPRYRAVTR